jgi:hypothetical protein
MIIHDFNIISVAVLQFKTNAPLPIDADAALVGSLSGRLPAKSRHWRTTLEAYEKRVEDRQLRQLNMTMPYYPARLCYPAVVLDN